MSSMALMRIHGAPLEVSDELPEKCRLFLEAYMKTRRLYKASKVMGVSVGQHKIWLGDRRGREHLKVPGYEEAFEVALDDVRAQEADILQDRVEKGLREVCTDGEGNIKYIRHRQSDATYKMFLQALHPAVYAPDREAGNNNVVIVLNHTNEGGWTEDKE